MGKGAHAFVCVRCTGICVSVHVFVIGVHVFMCACMCCGWAGDGSG